MKDEKIAKKKVEEESFYPLTSSPALVVGCFGSDRIGTDHENVEGEPRPPARRCRCGRAPAPAAASAGSRGGARTLSTEKVAVDTALSHVFHA